VDNPNQIFLSPFCCKSRVDCRRLFDFEMDKLLHCIMDFGRSQSDAVENILCRLCHCHCSINVPDDLLAQSEGPQRSLGVECLLSECYSGHGNHHGGNIIDFDSSTVAILGILGTVLCRNASHGLDDGDPFRSNLGDVLRATELMFWPCL
jgi:hypothetical protein